MSKHRTVWLILAMLAVLAAGERLLHGSNAMAAALAAMSIALLAHARIENLR